MISLEKLVNLMKMLISYSWVIKFQQIKFCARKTSLEVIVVILLYYKSLLVFVNVICSKEATTTVIRISWGTKETAVSKAHFIHVLCDRNH